MVGLGERAEEVVGVLGDCAAVGVDVATIGQYLRPARRCLPVDRYVHPDEFAAWERRGAALGLRLQAAPFVRSSYRAGDVLEDSR
jgi:lipoic acid synthetase